MMLPSSFHRLRQRWWLQPPRSRLEAWLMAATRGLDVLVSQLIQGRLSLWAMSLVYTTLLSLTPMLALAFSLLKALGVHNSLQPLLVETLKGLGPQQAQQVADSVVGFVGNVQVGVLGSLGVALLIYSALSLIQKVEGAFNEIWRVEKPRSLSARIGQYLAVLMVGPVIIFSVLGLTASTLSSQWVLWLADVPLLGFALHVLTGALPYMLIIGMFTFLYGFVPQARVSGRAAFAGGLIAGLSWQTASFAFASFVAGATNYNAIYSGFAIVIFVLIWLYLGWLILLCGCQIAYFVQHPQRLNPYAPVGHPAGRAREQLGLAILAAATQRFASGAGGANPAILAASMGLAEGSLRLVAADLVAAGWLAESQGLWLPARDPTAFTVTQAWNALRGEPLTVRQPELAASLAWILAQEQKIAETSGQPTLKQWAISTDAATGAGEKTAISQ